MDEAVKHMRLTARAIKIMGRIVGQYPYPHVTVVVTPDNAHAAAGMEYAMLFTTGIDFTPIPGLLGSEQTTVHEFIHQYFHHIFASNEFEEAWLDEGLTTYVTGLVMDEIYGSEKSILNFAGITMGSFPVQRLAYKYRPDWDPMKKFAWYYATTADYGVIVYAKSAVALKSLEGLIGRRKMEQVLQTYFKRFAFKHPRTADFMNVLNEVAGKPVAELFYRVVTGIETLDHRVVKITNRKHYPPRGVFGLSGKKRKRVKKKGKWGGTCDVRLK
jgi:aminopeptidase N